MNKIEYMYDNYVYIDGIFKVYPKTSECETERYRFLRCNNNYLL